MIPIEAMAWNKNTKKMVDLKKITPFALSIDPSITGGGVGLYIPDHPGLEIMLYTGKKDINDKKVFAGDKVKIFEESPCSDHPELNSVVEDIVEWDDVVLSWGTKFYCHHISKYEVEIIGHQYEEA